ncbi:MAG: amylo-alpha-1,6-glucosidase [Pleurocapsa minor HA4230-MV1]|jgi:predicted glycogen debranching enzyme|nr:amylo-alpha-1,6-glucosidase [Pleurocapsa minor HA4230-MV1]
MIQFGREVSSNREIAESREWLITNGIGGYGSGTIAGILTRNYHGLLVAALEPPVARTLLLTKLEETVNYNAQAYALAANRWVDDIIAPEGYLQIESFHLEGTTPVWNFAFADGLLSKRIWMQQGENTTYIRYHYQRGSQPLSLSLKALVNYRNHHGGTNSDAQAQIKPRQQGLEIKLGSDARSLYLSAFLNNPDNLDWSINNTWYHNFALAVEQYRGLNPLDAHLQAATVETILEPGDTITIIASTEANRQTVTEADKRKCDRQLIELFTTQNKLNSVPQWIKQLVLAADQFVVDRPVADNPHGKTIIAGYPWFTDWGRDTMISLPGIAIATGRYHLAQTILRTFAQYVDRGMLPNVFPDAGTTPEYNTVDATLWYFEALRNYYAATQDRELIAELFPLLAEIIDWHIQGTRYNIHLDDDGLIYAGETGVQLTWMDAKVENWVVTPRIGKPIEINALWYNALSCMVYFAQVLEQPDGEYQKLADKTRSHFAKFWYAEGGYCYDVIDSPDGNDASFRPNQIFAVSLPNRGGSRTAPTQTPLQPKQQQMVVDRVGQKLLTSFGLRSLDPGDKNYLGIYGGDRLQRDASYHRGTTWGWLIGHYVQAHLQVYQDPQLARSFIEPMADHLNTGCVGNISEIFDGDVPFTPRGCFAQAWSVAEVLRTWLLTVNQNNSVS